MEDEKKKKRRSYDDYEDSNVRTDTITKVLQKSSCAGRKVSSALLAVHSCTYVPQWRAGNVKLKLRL